MANLAKNNEFVCIETKKDGSYILKNNLSIQLYYPQQRTGITIARVDHDN